MYKLIYKLIYKPLILERCSRALDFTVITTVPPEVLTFWEYCLPQTNNHNRFIRLKFYYIFTLLTIHILLSTFPCYMYCQNTMFPMFPSDD